MKPPASSQPRRAAAAAFIGTMIEWFDFLHLRHCRRAGVCPVPCPSSRER